MNPDFEDILTELVRVGARFLVVGAHALGVHGHPRATGDLDLWVEPSPANSGRVWDALLAFGAPISALGIHRGDLEQTWDRATDRGPAPTDRPTDPDLRR